MASDKVATLSVPLWGVILLVASLSASLGVNVRGEMARYREKNTTERLGTHEQAIVTLRAEVAEQNAVDSMVLTKLDNIEKKVDDLSSDFRGQGQ